MDGSHVNFIDQNTFMIFEPANTKLDSKKNRASVINFGKLEFSLAEKT